MVRICRERGCLLRRVWLGDRWLRNLWRWRSIQFGVLLIPLLLLGCATRAGGGEMAIEAAQTPLVVDLPALAIAYDPSGIAYLGSVPVAELGAPLGIDLTRLNLAPAQIERIIATNIQHIQLTNRPQQLLILVNGRALPRLAWNETSLATGIETIQRLADLQTILPVELVTRLPILTELGGGVTLRFPQTAGAASIPLAWQPTDVSITAATQATYRDLIGTPPQLTFDVIYQADGSWTLDGLGATAWAALIPFPWEERKLQPELLVMLQKGDIHDLRLTANQQGIVLLVNGDALPHLDWSNGELSNLIALAKEGGLFTRLLGDTPAAYSLATTVERLLPLMQMTEIQVFVHFPL